MKYTISVLLFLVLFAGLSGQTQEQEIKLEKKDKSPIEQKKEPVYMKVNLWLIYSLARFDIGIDNNLIEIRAYVHLRKNNEKGDLITDADVRVNGTKLEFEKNRFVKRRILPGEFLEKINLQVHIPEGPCIKKDITVPTWLKLESPKPAVYEGTGDIEVKWKYTTCGSHVNLAVRNSHTGEYIIREWELKGNHFTLPAESLPPGETLLRFFVMEPWFNRAVISEPCVSKDSEVNIVSWSQSFIRVKK